MADTTTTPQVPIIRISLPGAGETTSYRLTADSLVKFDFDLAAAEFISNGNNLEIVVEGGGRIILEDYLLMAQEGTLPTFELMDGEQVAGEVYLFAFEDTAIPTEEELETAADAGATGSGAGDYSDDAGALFAGIDALGGQGDAYDSSAIEPVDLTIPEEIIEEAPLIPPVAIDDTNVIVEDGWNRGGEGDNYRTFPDQGQYGMVAGNLLLNDYDDDNIDYPETSGVETELLVSSIDFDGADFTGNNPGPVEVTDAGVSVNGLYGVLTVFADGSYTYQLDQNLADPLRPGQEVDEVFNYTAIDPDNNSSNVATLTITVVGENDPPEAVNDTPVEEVIEQGTVVPGIAVVSGNVLHNDSDIDNIGYEDLDPAYANLIPTDPDSLIELGVTSIYSFNTYDYDNTPEGGVFTVDGTYGTLTIKTDGSYEYTLDQTKADPLNIGDDPVETFSYSMWDGEKYDYATLTIHVNGSNDAPIGANDVNDFVEAVDDAAAHAVAGNVLTNDTDIDNVDIGDAAGTPELTVSDVIYSGGGTQVTAGSDYSANHILAGQWGTLYLNNDGSYHYVEDKNATDPLNSDSLDVTDVFTYTVNDNQSGGALTDTATLTITISGANDSPVATVDTNAFTEAVDTAAAADVSGNVLTNDTDIDNVDIGDAAGTPDLTVSGVVYSGGGTQVSVGSDYSANHILAGQWGTLYLNNDGSYHYVEDKNATDPLNSDSLDVTDVFTYTVNDNQSGGALTDTATLTITISGANDSPVATVDTNAFTEAVDDAAARDVSGNVLTNDTDIDNVDIGDAAGTPDLTVSGVVYSGGGTQVSVGSDYSANHILAGQWGTLYLNNDGTYNYVEDKNATDPLNSDSLDVTDVFTYTVTDNQSGGALTDTATLTITISGANDSPVATVDTNAFTEAVDDAAARDVSGNVLTNDTDIDNVDIGDAAGTPDLTVSGVVYSGGGTQVSAGSDYSANHILAGQWGTLYLNNDGTYNYVEDKNATDPLNSDSADVTDVFTYTVTDNQSGDALTDTATLTITISGANDSPVATVDTNAFTEAVDDAAARDVSGNVLTNDTDIDNVDIGDAAGTPDLTVSGVVYSGGGTQVSVGSDYSANHILAGQWGTLYLNNDGTYNYVEDKNATDPLNSDSADVTDVFTYTVTDNQSGGALTDTATLTITISGANDSPVATVDTNAFTEAVDDAAARDVSGNVLTNDTDIDNVDIGDAAGTPDLTVSGVVYSGGGTQVSVGSDYSANHILAGQWGTLYLNNDGTYNYVEDKNATDPLNSDSLDVTDVFTYTVTDNQSGGALTDTATLTITISGANDSPVATVDTNSFTEAVDDAAAGDVFGNVLANDTDIDNVDIGDAAGTPDLTVTSAIYSGGGTQVTAGSDYTANHILAGQWGTLYLNNDGSYHYVEDKDATDPLNIDDAAVTDVFTYTVSDNQPGGALTDTATLTITIDPANDTPVAVHDGSHEIFITNTVETVIDDWSEASGHSVFYGPGYTVSAASTGDPNALFTTWGNDQHLGIYTIDSSDDQKVDDLNGLETITFEYDNLQSQFSIEFIAHGKSHVNVLVYNSATYDPSDSSTFTTLTNVGNSVLVDPGFEFDTLVFTPDGAFGMESLTTITGGESNLDGVAEGNVLANDHDIDNVDYDAAILLGDPSLMEHSVSGIDSTNAPGNSSTSGADINGDFFTIDGEFGSLKIYETGEWYYTPEEEVDGEGGWQNLDSSQVDIFEYTVSDGSGGTDTAFIEVSLNVNVGKVLGGTGTIVGTDGSETIFPADGDSVQSAAGNDVIVIDPSHLGGIGGSVSILDFSDNDSLSLGNMEGATVAITSDDFNVSLVFTDIDGSDDIMVNLMGVNPVDNDFNQIVEITTSEDLNALIQSIIDSGNDTLA